MFSIDLTQFSGKFSVYICYKEDQVVYVGFSKVGLYRVFQEHHPTRKIGLTKIDIELFNSEEEARNREQFLIFSISPVFNVFMKSRTKPTGYEKIKKIMSSRNVRIIEQYFEEGFTVRQIAKKESITKSLVMTVLRNARRIMSGRRANDNGIRVRL